MEGYQSVLMKIEEVVLRDCGNTYNRDSFWATWAKYQGVWGPQYAGPVDEFQYFLEWDFWDYCHRMAGKAIPKFIGKRAKRGSRGTPSTAAAVQGASSSGFTSTQPATRMEKGKEKEVIYAPGSAVGKALGSLDATNPMKTSSWADDANEAAEANPPKSSRNDTKEQRQGQVQGADQHGLSGQGRGRGRGSTRGQSENGRGGYNGRGRGHNDRGRGEIHQSIPQPGNPYGYVNLDRRIKKLQFEEDGEIKYSVRPPIYSRDGGFLALGDGDRLKGIRDVEETFGVFISHIHQKDKHFIVFAAPNAKYQPGDPRVTRRLRRAYNFLEWWAADLEVQSSVSRRPKWKGIDVMMNEWLTLEMDDGIRTEKTPVVETPTYMRPDVPSPKRVEKDEDEEEEEEEQAREPPVEEKAKVAPVKEKAKTTPVKEKAKAPQVEEKPKELPVEEKAKEPPVEATPEKKAPIYRTVERLEPGKGVVGSVVTVIYDDDNVNIMDREYDDSETEAELDRQQGEAKGELQSTEAKDIAQDLNDAMASVHMDSSDALLTGTAKGPEGSEEDEEVFES